MREFLFTLIYIVTGTSIIYVAILNLFYTFNLIISAIYMLEFEYRYSFSKGIHFSSKASKSFSLVIPLYNEEKTVRQSVRSFLSIDHDPYEVILVDDGSADSTLDVLKKDFELVEVEVATNDICESKGIKAVYFSRKEPRLVVVSKENGGKADAQNAGCRVARNQYICVVDADTILDPESLSRMSNRFAIEPDVVALGGIIRLTNGCRIENGRVKEVRMPKKFIERVQVLEYFRAFLFGRMSMTATNTLMIISGAFGAFRFDVFKALGGWNRQAIGEDMDAVTRLHRLIHEKKLPWRVAFVPDPISWTQAPNTWRSLANQRERWQRGLMQVMFENIRMLFNPRYGRIGLVGYPYFFFLEMFSAVMEFICYPLTILCFLLGIFHWHLTVYIIVLLFIWGLCISCTTVILQQKIRYRYSQKPDLEALMKAAIIENFGFRQLHSFWRLHGMLNFIFSKKKRSSGLSGWASIPRESF